MTARLCPVDRCDATLADDEEICRGSARRLQLDLRDIPDLLDELDTTMARIGSSAPAELHGALTGGCKPGCDHAPDNPSCIAGARLDIDQAASEAAAHLRALLHSWVRVWDEETPIAEDDGSVGPMCRLAGLCGHASCLRILECRQAAGQRRNRDRLLHKAERQALLLASQPLAGRVWAPELAGEIRDAVRQARRAIDVPPEVTLAGTCSCGAAVYAVSGDTRARCRSCGLWHDAQDLHDAMLQARGHLHTAPAAVIARMLVDPTTGKPMCTAAQIRGWRHRGLLEVAEVNPAGQPCYRIDRVAELARNGAND